jgi:hypothetical protein
VPEIRARMRRLRFVGRRLPVAAAIIGGGLLVASVPSGETAGTIPWQGTLHYIAVQPPGFPRVSGLRLRVTRGAVVAYNRAVPLPRACAQTGCRLALAHPGQPFSLVDFGVGAGPVALIWLSTKGPGCCRLVQTVSVPSGRIVTKNFGSAPARVFVINGAYVFVSGDDRFSTRFASVTPSALPIRIYRFAGGPFADATRRFPSAVAADAARWWQRAIRARRDRADARGPFAAWAADTCLLGRWALVARELSKAVGAGAFSPPRVESRPAGTSYAAALTGRLRAWGYCR